MDSGSESDDSSEGGIDDMTPEEIDAEIAFLQAEETSTALKKGAREAIIVINGCFCPVHAGHLRSLEETKRLVEASGEFRCVAGYFAVAPDKAVKKKVVGKLKPWMTQAARVEMCSAVPPESGAKWTLRAGAYGGWKQCGAEMIQRYHSAETEVFSVPKEAKLHTYELLTSTAIRAELAAAAAAAAPGTCSSEIPLGGTCSSEIVDSLVQRKLIPKPVGECLLRF